jgi:hypothetical protein
MGTNTYGNEHDDTSVYNFKIKSLVWSQISLIVLKCVTPIPEKRSSSSSYVEAPLEQGEQLMSKLTLKKKNPTFAPRRVRATQKNTNIAWINM